MDEVNFLTRLATKYEDVKVNAIYWSDAGHYRPEPGGTGPQAILERAVFHRYPPRSRGLEEDWTLPLIIGTLGAGPLMAPGVEAVVAKTATPPRVWHLVYDPRNFKNVISKEYWKLRRPANGRALHHWLFPQSATWVPAGIRNAGFNLIELPSLRGWFHPTLNLNTWMGWAPKWGGSRAMKARAVEWGIRLAIPSSLGGAGYLGWEVSNYLMDEDQEE